MMVITTSLRDQTKQAVERLIAERLHHRINDAAGIHPAYELLWRRIYDVVLDGGKCFRPYLTMVGYGTFSEAVVPVAAAQELVHVAMLMHDDIIDEDTLRRGKKNINGMYEETYRAYVNHARAVHYSHSAGLMGGDALISEAYDVLLSSQFDDRIKHMLVERLHRSIFEVIGGELMDVEAAFVSGYAYDPMRIYRYKTAGYSFIGPLLAGALCTNASADTMHILEQFGQYAGVAFQLQDDLLGVFGDESELGKSVLLDLRESKETHLVATHKRRMNVQQRKRFEKDFGRASATEAALLAIRDDMEQSGARAENEQLIDELFSKASGLLDGLHNPLQRTELLGLVRALSGRKT